MPETYFTGRPCKNGHISDRYLKTRHCVKCVTKIETRQKLSGFITQKVRVYHETFDALAAYVWALGSVRIDGLRQDQVVSKAAPTGCSGGTGLYKVKVHPDDSGALATFVADLVASVGVLDVERARAQAMRLAAGVIGPTEPPPMVFK